MEIAGDRLEIEAESSALPVAVDLAPSLQPHSPMTLLYNPTTLQPYNPITQLP